MRVCTRRVRAGVPLNGVPADHYHAPSRTNTRTTRAVHTHARARTHTQGHKSYDGLDEAVMKNVEAAKVCCAVGRRGVTVGVDFGGWG